MPGNEEARGAANCALKTTLGELEAIRTSFALVNTDVTRGSALFPASAISSTNNTLDLPYDQSVLWGNSVVWGTSVV
jgi:hypothetical protein